MSKNTKPDATSEAASAEVAEHATETAKLPLNRPVLLGTFGSSEMPGALIRLTSGDVVKVAKGENTRIGEIVAIAEGEVIVAQNGRTTRMTIPR